MIKKTLSVLIVLMSISINSQQKNINNYKYIIISNKFDFLTTADKYQTSSLTKFLLKKKGFTVFKSDENLPEELSKDKCLALMANVIDVSGMLNVKSKIELRDCNNNLVYTSKEGKSKQKLYKKAYQESIRNAYNSMTDIRYSYQPVTKDVIAVNIPKKVVSSTKKIQPKKIETPIKKEEVSIVEELLEKPVKKGDTILYAQLINNGFQLVNKKPEVIFLLLKTNIKDFFILKDKNGILYKKENKWIAEFYEGNKLVVKKYQIKF